jgi:Uma2 family endonuclease
MDHGPAHKNPTMPTIPMAVQTSRPRKTVADYLALPDDVRAELIQGELYVTPAPDPRHQDVIGLLYVLLHQHVEANGLGRVYLSPVDVHLPSGEVVQPDLLYIARDRLGMVGKRIEGVPDLAIEVVSPTHPERDRIVKRDLYAENGVREYWVVELDSRAVEVLRLDGRAYVPAGYFSGASRIVSTVLREVSIDVGSLFRE